MAAKRPATKALGKKAPAKKATTKRPTATKALGKNATTKRPTATKALGKNATTKRPTATEALAKRSPAKKATAKKAAKPLANLVRLSVQGGPFEGVSGPTIRRRAEKMLTHRGLSGVELSVALVDDATIHELNRTWRKKDKPTDVLAFPLAEGAEAGAPGSLLGDVIVSIDTARKQAAQRRRPLLDEVTMLLAHGLLHLLGYDHNDDDEEREMTARTRDLEAAAAVRAPTKSR